MDTITQNFHDWDLEKEDKIVMSSKKRGILELSEEDMKEASKSIKERGIKTIELNELSAMDYKVPNDEPHFPIQVNAICSSKGNEKV